MSSVIHRFRPKRARWAALSAMALIIVLAGLAALFQPGGAQFMYVWRVSVPVLTAILALILWLVARPHAIATNAGLEVVNMIRSTKVAWAQIVAVRLGRGAPWVLLDLSDASTLAVMAIQSSDGPRALEQAQLLADLVAQKGAAGQ